MSASEQPSPEQGDLTEDGRLLQLGLIVFSAVSLASVEFVKRSLPDVDVVEVTRSAIVYTLVTIVGVPVLLILLIDRAIAARARSARPLLMFRTAVFVLAFVFLLRQAEIYWGPGKEMAHTLRSATPVLLWIVGLALVVAFAWLCLRVPKAPLLFFLYMSPIAIAITAIVPYQLPTGGEAPDAYAREVSLVERDAGDPAVFVIILDELAYPTVTAADGELDAALMPNVAALAQDGAWFSNATTNYFWTRDSIPKTILNPIFSLAGQYDVRLYSQYPAVEDTYLQQCGTAYTCRGATYLTRNNPGKVAGNLALRAFYEAAPGTIEGALKVPLGWAINGLNSAYPSADEGGWHVFTKQQFDVFMNDIDAQEARRSIYLWHSLGTHWPYVFDQDGDPLSSHSEAISLGTDWAHPRRTAALVDSMLGRFITKLKAEEIYDDSIIIITADHGLKSYLPSPERPPGQFQVQVPLLIKAPGLRGITSDVDYQHVDFGATLRDLLDLPRGDGGEGVSVFATDRPERDKRFHVDDWTFVQHAPAGAWQFVEE